MAKFKDNHNEGSPFQLNYLLQTYWCQFGGDIRIFVEKKKFVV